MPPLIGLTDETVGVKDALYENDEVSDLEIELTVIETVHVESSKGVDEAGVFKIDKSFIWDN